MILRMPLYYKKFHCIAERCKDNCCIGWEIDIDPETSELYRKTEGGFGERLRKNISGGEVDSFILGENERCPFLNERNLCDIILNMGENALCDICREHPRYYEWYGDIKEGGIGLCCEEAARIILEENEPFSFYEAVISEEADYTVDEEFFGLLSEARERIFEKLYCDGESLQARLWDIVRFAAGLQENLDNGEMLLPEMTVSDTAGEFDIKPLMELVGELEPIDEGWTEYYDEMMKISDKTADNELPAEAVGYLRNIAVYFIWRYFLKGVFDGEIYSRVMLAVMSTAVIGRFYLCEALKGSILSLGLCADRAKLFSKELEYSEENIERLLDAAYELFPL